MPALGDRSAKQSGRLRLAYLARISPGKNLITALDMLEGLEGEIAFDVHGPIEDRRYWARCEERMRRLPRNVTVRYRGAVPFGAASEVLARYDALLLPTLGENFGHVIVEALAAGCPPIVSNRTPWRDLEARRVGWDLPLEEPERFRAALAACVRMGADEHREWSEEARRYAQEVTTDPSALEATRRLFTDA
jgi:glycosyltransferase involved in cell wall biosynthesis